MILFCFKKISMLFCPHRSHIIAIWAKLTPSLLPPPPYVSTSPRAKKFLYKSRNIHSTPNKNRIKDHNSLVDTHIFLIIFAHITPIDIHLPPPSQAVDSEDLSMSHAPNKESHLRQCCSIPHLKRPFMTLEGFVERLNIKLAWRRSPPSNVVTSIINVGNI